MVCSSVPLALSSPLQCWWLLVTQTEALSQTLQRHAEALVAGPLQKLGLLIRSKQQLRRSYTEQWQHMNQDFLRVQSPLHSFSTQRGCLLSGGGSNSRRGASLLYLVTLPGLGRV